MKSPFQKLFLFLLLTVFSQICFAQKPSNVVIDAIRIVPNTISQSQTHGIIYVDISNNGNSAIEIVNPSLSNNRGANLQEVYLGPPAPAIVSKGTSSSLIYSFIAPPSTQGILGSVDLNAQFTSQEVKSGKTEVIYSINPGTFVIQTPAAISHIITTPVSSLGNTNEQFKVTFTNSGQATIVLNPAMTVLNIGSVLQIPLDGTSPTVISASPDQTELIFQNTLITDLPYGVYPLSVTLNGITNGAAYNRDISSGSFAFGSDLVDVNTPFVNEPSRNFLQGTTDIHVNLQVTNSSVPHSIDAGSTTLIFKNHLSGGIQSVINLQRMDGLTTLPLGTSNLQFSFDIPSGFPIGQTDIFGQVSLDSGAIEIQSADSIDIHILSGANISYKEESISPRIAIHRQTISVKLVFSNTGTSNLSLSVDSTYIDFPGTTIPRSTINGNYSIAGESSVAIIFKETTVSLNQPLGNLDINWHLKGIQITGDTLETSGTISNAIEIIAASQLEFSSIDILPTMVQQGQNNIRIDYQVSNTGASAALVDNILFNFLNNGIPTPNWIPMTSGLFPDTILSGENKIYKVDFSVSTDADTGIVISSPTIEFRDILLPQLKKTSDRVISNDSIRVVTPALLRIDSLQFINDDLSPNAPRVNIDQNFNLELILSNNGKVAINSAFVTLKRGSAFLKQIHVQNITPGSKRTIPINVSGIESKGEFVYSAFVDSSRDEYGLKVVSGQPIDNSETVIVQQPRHLSLTNVRLISPPSALDSSVTINQIFTVQAVVQQTGESSIGTGTIQLSLPENYSFSYDFESIQPISLQNLTLSWQVYATSASIGIFDTLFVNFSNIPQDINTGQKASIGVDSVQVFVVSEPQAYITIDTTLSPKFVSVGQSFEYSVIADIISDNLISPNAEFTLPKGLTGSTDQIITVPIEPDNKKAKLVVNIPQNYSGADTAILRVRLIGTDINSNLQKVSSTFQNKLHIQSRPKIYLTSKVIKPQSAKEGFLSFGQEIEIKLWAELSENTTSFKYAGLSGSGTITLNNRILSIDGFELISEEVQSKSFLQTGEEFAQTWRVRAPEKQLSTSIEFTLTQLPKDVNSGMQVLSDDPVESKVLTVRQKEIVVTLIDSLVPSNSFIQGQKNRPLLAFKISNEGYGDSLFLDNLKIGFYETQSHIVSSTLLSNISEIFTRFKIVNYNYYSIMQKQDKISNELNFAEVSIDPNSVNPLSLDFNIKKLSIEADTTETILVLADIDTHAKIKRFRTKLMDINIFDVSNDIKLIAVNEKGDDFFNSADGELPIQYVGSSNPEKSFFIYPNPFGRGDTNLERMGFFNFYLEQVSDVKIIVFNLLGDLVWSEERSALPAANYDTLIKWDGKNSNGKRVLNGVYIAAIEIRPTSGKSTKRYLTKIAYIK